MATKQIFLLLSIFTIVSFSYPQTTLDTSPSSFIQYKLADDHRYRSSLVSFLHRQPDGSQLATIRYYRLVFHCHFLPGSLFLRFSNEKPYRTVVQNRHDPSTIFAFRSVGAYSRVQIQSRGSGLWLCLNRRGHVVQKPNVSIDNLSCTFRQSSDGIFMNLISELDPTRRVTFDTFFLLSMNPNLRRRFSPLFNEPRRKELCQRFLFDSEDID